jgi:drug/metabolite transporter (DMT)-like permease
MKADLLTLGAIFLWASLASLAALLSNIPPFLLTGIGLIIGALVCLPALRSGITPWKVPLKTLLIGVYGLFGYHFMLFLALQTAPAVQANLVNYLWPLLIVLLSPIFTKSLSLNFRYVLAAISGFAGAVIAITYNGSVLESLSSF